MMISAGAGNLANYQNDHLSEVELESLDNLGGINSNPENAALFNTSPSLNIPQRQQSFKNPKLPVAAPVKNNPIKRQ